MERAITQMRAAGVSCGLAGEPFDARPFVSPEEVLLLMMAVEVLLDILDCWEWIVKNRLCQTMWVCGKSPEGGRDCLTSSYSGERGGAGHVADAFTVKDQRSETREGIELLSSWLITSYNESITNDDRAVGAEKTYSENRGVRVIVLHIV